MSEDKITSDWTYVKGDQSVEKVLVFYVPVGQAPPDSIDKAIGNYRDRLKPLLDRLSGNVGGMFIPTRGESNVEYIVTTDQMVKE